MNAQCQSLWHFVLLKDEIPSLEAEEPRRPRYTCVQSLESPHLHYDTHWRCRCSQTWVSADSLGIFCHRPMREKKMKPMWGKCKKKNWLRERSRCRKTAFAHNAILLKICFSSARLMCTNDPHLDYICSWKCVTCLVMCYCFIFSWLSGSYDQVSK